MIVKIRFSEDYKVNKIKESEIMELQDYLGEEVKFRYLKRSESGELSNYSYMETFDEEKAKNNNEYTYFEKSGYVKIESSEQYIVDLPSFMEKYPNLEYTVKSIGKSNSDNPSLMIEKLNSIAKKIQDISNSFTENIQFNNKCEVHVPNLGLLNINRLAYATNKCTEELQLLLNQGWHLLAICPQPNQRRPDYILGKSIEGIDTEFKVINY